MHVCVSVCLSITTLAATAINHWPKEKFHRFLYDFFVDLAKKALYQKYGVFYLQRLPSMLPDELSANTTGSNGFFSQQKVCTISYKTTDSSPFSSKEPLSVLASCTCYSCALHNHALATRASRVHVLFSIFVVTFATQLVSPTT